LDHAESASEAARIELTLGERPRQLAFLSEFLICGQWRYIVVLEIAIKAEVGVPIVRRIGLKICQCHGTDGRN
jgi:hypothetical protein